jgi:arabinan endo-1,5-alpha-L-arabinosidase
MAEDITRRAIHRRAFIGGSVLTLATFSLSRAATPSLNERMQGDFAPVHDPCIIKQGEWYYIFSTSVKTDTGGHIACRRSRDLATWERCGFVFAEIPAWARQSVPRAKSIWAPDISIYNDTYHLYYSVSSFGSNQSVIGLATNTTLDPQAPGYAWVDRGLVVQSRLRDRYNAIDPNLIADRDGKYWLSWGSFWDGIMMARIDPATGLRLESEKKIHSLAWRPVARGGASEIEAPFIISHGDYYYLFVSFDLCCRGVDSTYFVVCGRSKNITGPYVDVNDRPLTDGGGSIVIQGDARFKGTGHNAVLHEGDRDYLVYHAYDVQHEGTPTLRISPIYWTPDGWPLAKL